MTSVKFESQLTRKDYVIISLYSLSKNKKFWGTMLLFLFLLNLILRFLIKSSLFYSVIVILFWIFLNFIYRVLEFLKMVSRRKGLEKINWEINQEVVEGRLGHTVVTKICVSKIFKISEIKNYIFIYEEAQDVFISKALISNADLNSIRFFLGKKIAK